jgi:hypothetical protein
MKKISWETQEAIKDLFKGFLEIVGLLLGIYMLLTGVHWFFEG